MIPSTSEKVALFPNTAKAKHWLNLFRTKRFWENVGAVAKQDMNKSTAKVRSALLANFVVTMKTVVLVSSHKAKGKHLKCGILRFF